MENAEAAGRKKHISIPGKKKAKIRDITTGIADMDRAQGRTTDTASE